MNMQLQATTLSRSELLNAAVDAAERAGRFLQSHFWEENEVKFKEKHDVQLDADLKAEEIVRLCLSDVSEYKFIGEESCQERGRERYVWVVDPLDGSANYARGIPHFATSIALLEEGVPVLGVVRNHVTGELMTALSGNGAWMDGVPLNVSKTGALERSIIAGGFMKTDEVAQRNIDFMRKAVVRTFKLRVTGAAALDLCSVAMGRFDIYSEKGIRIWDISAGLLIANEAGASISISRVDDISYDLTVLNPRLEDEFIEAFPETAPFGRTMPNLMKDERV
jgi:myo-inositol-1(or 4)-monophosphatase